MIATRRWQAVLAMFAAGCIGFLLGGCTLALAAMAHYDGDEQRSEAE